MASRKKSQVPTLILRLTLCNRPINQFLNFFSFCLRIDIKLNERKNNFKLDFQSGHSGGPGKVSRAARRTFVAKFPNTKVDGPPNF